ncbi:hypothetical protein BU23DRAFT_604385 [Bimuria novae-zelandiae CBS 107.79]|uniref:Uncharacterized protein n=1 Tax=Bimuria novae-zelandiae CBS 107.79 TaxID=1447943 RepID=A0A6A5UK01_9PLEO|nr:hypothetical protein BU23DRAFT_604385 [Bimuria novae-zelandiae CBS 107.79]
MAAATQYSCRPRWCLKARVPPSHPVVPPPELLPSVHRQDEEGVTAVPQRKGQYDMYSDDSDLTQDQWRRVETQLGKLESKESEIFKRLVSTCGDGESFLELSHSDVTVLKIFIFVMKYRSKVFFERYNHKKREDYNADDKDNMLAYMRINNSSSLLTSGSITSLGSSLLNEEEEFVLSEHGYTLHEGPVDGEGKAWTDYHTLCIVDPRLAIIMRWECLPELVDDRDHAIRELNLQMMKAGQEQHANPKAAVSQFHHLPVYKLRNGYSKGENDEVIYNARSSIKNADGETALRLALESFVPLPGGGPYSVKNYPAEDDDRVKHLKKLEKVARSLNSKVTVAYQVPSIYNTTNPYDLWDLLQTLTERGTLIPSDLGTQANASEDPSGLYGPPLLRAQHAADIPVPFTPKSVSKFRASFMKQMAGED